jgi:hypothetical protein
LRFGVRNIDDPNTPATCGAPNGDSGLIAARSIFESVSEHVLDLGFGYIMVVYVRGIRNWVYIESDMHAWILRQIFLDS